MKTQPAGFIAQAGKGRPKGVQNKSTRQAKEAIALAAEKLGGAERLYQWTQEDPDNEKVFWQSIYPKLIPVLVEGDVRHDHTHEQIGLSDAITWLAAARGEQEATSH